MYVIRRIAKAQPGKVWQVANLLIKICAAYEEITGEGGRLIIRTDLNERIKELGIREDAIDKDYVEVPEAHIERMIVAIGWALRGIGSDPRLKTSWAFKGGL